MIFCCLFFLLVFRSVLSSLTTTINSEPKTNKQRSARRSGRLWPCFGQIQDPERGGKAEPVVFARTDRLILCRDPPWCHGHGRIFFIFRANFHFWVFFFFTDFPFQIILPATAPTRSPPIRHQLSFQSNPQFIFAGTADSFLPERSLHRLRSWARAGAGPINHDPTTGWRDPGACQTSQPL